MAQLLEDAMKACWQTAAGSCFDFFTQTLKNITDGTLDVVNDSTARDQLLSQMESALKPLQSIPEPEACLGCLLDEEKAKNLQQEHEEVKNIASVLACSLKPLVLGSELSEQNAENLSTVVSLLSDTPNSVCKLQGFGEFRAAMEDRVLLIAKRSLVVALSDIMQSGLGKNVLLFLTANDMKKLPVDGDVPDKFSEATAQECK